MAHIRFGSITQNVPDDEVDELKVKIGAALADGGVHVFDFTDGDGDVTSIFVTPGVHVSIHSWDNMLG